MPTPDTPAMAAQRRVLAAILASGGAAPALAAAAAAVGDPFDALATLPVTGYEPYAAAAGDVVAAARAGDVAAARGHLARLLACPADSAADGSHVVGFCMTSGTSGNAAKLFPITVATQKARAAYFRIMSGSRAKSKLAATLGRSEDDLGLRLGLAVPGLPEKAARLVVDAKADADAADAAPPSPPAWAGLAPAADNALRIGPATAVMLGPVLERIAAADGDESGADMMGGGTLSYPPRILTAFDAPVAARHYMMWLATLAGGGKKVTQLSDFFGGSILSAVAVLRDHAASIAADLRAGCLSPAFPASLFPGAPDLPPAVRRAVDTAIGGPKPHAADALLAAAAANSPSTPLLAALLPSLRFVSAITGSMKKYAPRVAAMAPAGCVLVSDFYGGSEGFYAINAEVLQPGPFRGAGGDVDQRFVLGPAGDVVFEFLPLADEGAPPVALDAVALGTDYELVVTTFAGLARYRVGDVVRVVGTAPMPAPELAGGDAALAAELAVYEGAPVIEFVRRAGAGLNLVWEKFDEAALVDALAHAGPWADFAAREEAAPADSGLPHYVVYAEPARDGDDTAAWPSLVEAALRAANSVYALLVARGQIAPVQVAVVGRGAFDALKAAAVARGTSHAQYKTPVVVEAGGARAGVLEGRVVWRGRAEK